MIPIIDSTITKILTHNSGLEVSRRSFLSRSTKMILAMTGVGLIENFAPFVVTMARAAAPTWQTCGLHGGDCSSNIYPNPLPGPGGWVGSWQQCCQDPNSKCWACCTYTDWCTVTSQFKDGTVIPWCNTGQSGNKNVYYYCTGVACSTNSESSDQTTCGNNCKSPAC